MTRRTGDPAALRERVAAGQIATSASATAARRRRPIRAGTEALYFVGRRAQRSPTTWASSQGARRRAGSPIVLGAALVGRARASARSRRWRATRRRPGRSPRGRSTPDCAVARHDEFGDAGRRRSTRWPDALRRSSARSRWRRRGSSASPPTSRTAAHAADGDGRPAELLAQPAASLPPGGGAPVHRAARRRTSQRLQRIAEELMEISRLDAGRARSPDRVDGPRRARTGVVRAHG